MPRTTGTGKKMTKQQRFNSVCKKCKFAFKKYVDPISRSWLSQWANWRLHGAKWQFARPFCAHYWIMSQIVWQHSGSFWQHRNWPCCVFSVWMQNDFSTELWRSDMLEYPQEMHCLFVCFAFFFKESTHKPVSYQSQDPLYIATQGHAIVLQ